MPTTGPGRPTKLTPELQADYLKALRRCLYLETAARCVDLDPKTVQNWMRDGKKEPNGEYGEFFRAVKRELALAEAERVSMLTAHGAETWQALAWLNERSAPERWGDQKREVRKLEKLVRQLLAERDANAKPAVRPETTGGKDAGNAPVP